MTGTFRWPAASPLTAGARRSPTGANGERRELVVDADGLAEAHRWTYDAAGRLLRYQDPAGQTLDVTLDGLGREVALAHPAAPLTRQFGSDGHLAAELHPSGARLVFEHDGSGRVTAVEGLGAPGSTPSPGSSWPTTP